MCDLITWQLWLIPLCFHALAAVMPWTPVVLCRTYLPTSSSAMLLSNGKLAPSIGLILKLLSSFRGAHFAQELDCISASTFSWGQLQLDGHGQSHSIVQLGVKTCPQGGECPTWRPYMRNDYNYILWDDKIRLFDHFIGRGMAHLLLTSYTTTYWLHGCLLSLLYLFKKKKRWWCSDI